MKEILNMYNNLNKDNLHLLATLYQKIESLAISIEAVLPLLRRGSFPHLAVVGSSAAYLPLPRPIWNKIAEQMVKK